MKVKKIEKPHKAIRFLKSFWIIVLAFIYLIFPLDIIPDVLPVIGWGDDALVVLIGVIINLIKVNKHPEQSMPEAVHNIVRAVIKGKNIREVMEILRENDIKDEGNEIIEGEIIDE